MENLVFRGRISNIYLNRNKDLEISFEKPQDSLQVEKHVVIPIHEQIAEQELNNESVYIKIDLQNE